MGNPVADVALDDNSVPAYLASQSLISRSMYAAALEACDGGRFHDNPSRSCAQAQDAMYAAGELAGLSNLCLCAVLIMSRVLVMGPGAQELISGCSEVQKMQPARGSPLEAGLSIVA